MYNLVCLDCALAIHTRKHFIWPASQCAAKQWKWKNQTNDENWTWRMHSKLKWFFKWPVQLECVVVCVQHIYIENAAWLSWMLVARFSSIMFSKCIRKYLLLNYSLSMSKCILRLFGNSFELISKFWNNALPKHYSNGTQFLLLTKWFWAFVSFAFIFRKSLKNFYCQFTVSFSNDFFTLSALIMSRIQMLLCLASISLSFSTISSHKIVLFPRLFLLSFSCHVGCVKPKQNAWKCAGSVAFILLSCWRK